MKFIKYVEIIMKILKKVNIFALNFLFVKIDDEN